MEKGQGGDLSYRDLVSMEAFLDNHILFRSCFTSTASTYSSEHISSALAETAFAKQVTGAKSVPIVFYEARAPSRVFRRPTAESAGDFP